MKITFLFLLLSINLTAQVKAPGTDFILKAGSVFWQHSYEAQGMSAQEVAEKLEAKFSGNEGYHKTDKKIVFLVNNDKPNIKKYGAKEMKTSIIAQLYMKYNVSIELAENSYTVTVKNVFMDNKDKTENVSGELTKFVCNTSNLTFKTSESIQKGLVYNHMHFLEKFQIDIAATHRD